MNHNATNPPGQPALELMAEQIRAKQRKRRQEQASPLDDLEAQMCRENALRKMLQKVSDQRNVNRAKTLTGEGGAVYE